MGNSNSGPSDNLAESTPKKGGAFQISREPLGDAPLPDPGTHKFESTAGSEAEPSSSATPAYDDLGELPQTYGDDTLFLIARDPHWLFSYWDVNWLAWQPKAALGKFYLKLFGGDGAAELTTEIHPEARNWYLPVKHSGVPYYTELGFFGADGEWVTIVRSATATPPLDQFSDATDADFATVPIHLSFQHLVEMVRGHMQDGESLIAALARLQGEGRSLLFQPGKTPEWTEEQRQVLAALFGQEVVDRIAMGSGEIDQLLRKDLLEKLSTESASELVSKGRMAALLGGAQTSLFSAFAAGGLGASAFGSETTSWFGGGLGSSWSAQPFGQEQGREFFMHVNAEVIFYGGTHPAAKLWIDGKQVQLAPDGSFRHHFRFPDGTYSIPIVAESPDGVEQRSASLRFDRATARQGAVGHTAQPEHLGAAPMGRQ